MTEIMIRILVLLVGYIFGLFQTGFLYGKLVQRDLKKEGSGNTGATNALRVLGVKSALIIFFGDALKAFLVTFGVRMLFTYVWPTELAYVYAIYAAFGVSLGNDFPFYLKFRGGKGVAAASGFVLALDFRIWILGMSVFFIIAFATRYVSLASSIVAFVILGAFSLFCFMGWMPIPAVLSIRIEFVVVVFFVMLLMLFRHKDNIKRLINGTENRFGKKKEK